MLTVVLCVYPRAGLANKLLVLAKSYSLAHDIGGLVVETLFAQLPLVSSLRNRCQSRTYLSSPIQKNIFLPLLWSFLYGIGFVRFVAPLLRPFLRLEVVNSFDSYPLHANPFNDLTNNKSGIFTRTALRQRLGLESLAVNKQNSCRFDRASVHIRLGDFKVRSDSVIAPNSRTSFVYYNKIIENIVSFYESHGLDWTLNIYTDDINSLDNKLPFHERINLCSGDPFDDFIHQINCDILVPSPWSTFSGLAAHLSLEKLVILPEDLHFQFSDNPNLTVLSPQNLSHCLTNYYSHLLR